MSVRVRFAPSPTGLPHLGVLRTALFNYLFAKQHKGTFILRFEDTDRSRLVAEAEAYIEESLAWLGLDWDEGADKAGSHGPYRQSERLDIYAQHAKALVDQGRLYRDWTSPDQLEALRAAATKAKQPFLLRQDMLESKGDIHKPHVLRFKIDTSAKIDWHDSVFGDLSYDSNTLDDFVAIKSDGYPTYNFANVIDDHLMGISHIIRGEEFISSTPKYLQVYQAFGWQPPETAHVPQVLGTDKTKLSKRHGAESALVYKDKGYLPAAVVNFLASLGWNDGSEQEIFSREELIEKFSLERIQKSPAAFDLERLNWLNGHYIRSTPIKDLLKQIEPFWPQGAAKFDDAYKQKVLQASQDRLKFLAEVPELTPFFFERPKLAQRHKTEAEKLFVGAKITASDWLDMVAGLFADKDYANPEGIETKLKAEISEVGDRPAALFGMLRIALTAADNSPPIWDIMWVLGPKETVDRLEAARRIL